MKSGDRIEVTCAICHQPLGGYAYNFDDLMKVVAKHKENKGVGIICAHCGTAYGYEHKKELGWKAWSGFDRIPCMSCGNPLKAHLTIVHVHPDSLGEVAQVTAVSPGGGNDVGVPADIRKLAEEKKYDQIIGLLSKSTAHLPGVEDAIREAFAGCDDDALMEKLSSNLAYSGSSAAGVFSGMALAFTGSPKAVGYLMEAFEKGGGFGSSINQVSLNGVVLTCLKEIGRPGLEAMLVEMEKRGTDSRIPGYIGGAIREFATAEDISTLQKGLALRNYDTRKTVVELLVNLGWKPESEHEKAITLIANGDWQGLESLGSAAEKVLIDTLSLQDPGFLGMSPFRNLIEVLGKVGGEAAVEPLLGMLQEGSYSKQVVEALGAIGDPRAVRPILAHSEATKGMKALNASVYADALAGIGRAAIPELQAALMGDKKTRKIAKKSLNQIG